MTAVATGRRKGTSLVKGPVAIVGILGIAIGVLGLIFGGHNFSVVNVPHGAIYGKRWLGIELNGWSNLLFIGAGLLLLLGSPIHWGAKTTAFVVAGVLGAAAVIAVIRGNGVFGIFAANHRTEIIWGGAAIVLVLLSMLPRVGGRSRAVAEPVDRDARGREEPAARREPVARDQQVAQDQPVTRNEPIAQDEGTGNEAVAQDEPVERDEVAARREPVARAEPGGRDRWTAPDDRDAGDRPESGDEPLTREEAVDRTDPASSEGRAREERTTNDAPTGEAWRRA